MKHHDPDLHLTDDELLRAMVDPSDLDPTRKAHLESCLQCRRQAQDLTDHYNRLGRMARQMAPEPRKSFRVPAHTAPVGRWHFKPVMALGVLGALVFALTLWGPRFTRILQTPTPIVAHNFENDDHLMEEIDALVDDPLPEEYQQLAALSDDRSVEDLDEFMDWMVPSPEEAGDVQQPASSDREGRPGPLARSDAMVSIEEGMTV